MTQSTTTRMVTASAVVLMVGGVALVFAPDEIASSIDVVSDAPIVLSLWGSALFGFGIMNWTARRMVLGGIYGRALVAGNQAHAFVGSLMLAGIVFRSGGPPVLLAIFVAYAVYASLFSYLMFVASGEA